MHELGYHLRRHLPLVVASFLGLSIFFMLQWFARHMPTAEDAALAKQVGDVVTTEYGRFTKASTFERSHRGQMLYWKGQHDKTSVLFIYGVSSDADVRDIVSAAHVALGATGAPRIELRFMDRRCFDGCREHVALKMVLGDGER